MILRIAEKNLTLTYVIEIYCHNTDCNVRHCEIVTKDFGDNPEPKTWHCPGCGHEATVHWRRDLVEHEREELCSAIGRVNAALYTRDQKDVPASVPANILMLDSLPDSWKCERTPHNEH
jgi:hypothetical protein